MSLKLNERYPGRFNNPSADYPQGSFKNRTSPTAKDGSYLEKDWANDKEGFFQSLIAVAGIVPSGTADKVGASQYYDALLSVLYSAARKTPVLTDTGTAGIYAAANTPALTALPSTGYMQRVNISNLNPGASTYSPDGLAAKPIYGLGLQPLQGDELPAGIAVLMYLVQAGVNGGNGAWIIVESLGGASQTAPATKSRHAVQLAQMAAVVGGTRNAKMSIPTASATATFTADEVAVKAALGGSAWLLSSFSKAVNLGTVGAGGMDTGAAPVSGFVALYAIYNPTTGASALLAANASTLQSNVYGGVSMPAGYTASALISVWPTTSGGLLDIGYQVDRSISRINTAILNSNTVQASAVSLNFAAVAPVNARSISGVFSVSSTAASQMNLSLTPTVSTVGQQACGINSAASIPSIASIYSRLPISTPQTLWYSATSSAGTPTFFISITGYEF